MVPGVVPGGVVGAKVGVAGGVVPHAVMMASNARAPIMNSHLLVTLDLFVTVHLPVSALKMLEAETLPFGLGKVGGGLFPARCSPDVGPALLVLGL